MSLPEPPATVHLVGTVYKSNRTLQVTAERIRFYRKARGLSAEAFGAAIGTEATNVRRLERGTENISLVRLEHIAEVLGVEITDLLTPPAHDLASRLGPLGFDVLPAGKAPGPRDIAIWDVRPHAGHAPAQSAEPQRLGWARPRKRRRSPDALVLVRVAGDSMAPAIPDGAWCLFRQPVRDPRPRLRVLLQLVSGADPVWLIKQIGAVEAQGDSAIRLRLDSLNPAYPPQTVVLRDDGDVELLGELVEVLKADATPSAERLTAESSHVVSTWACRRMRILPTHPCLLLAMVQFQRRMADYFTKGSREDLRQSDIEQLVPGGLAENWSLSDGRNFTLTDSAPFHLAFVPDGGQAARGAQGHIGRIVAAKAHRYLRMHPHLRNRRRTLKLGFVNAGDGAPILDGLDLLLRKIQREHAGRLRELPEDQIPDIEVFLFGSGDSSMIERFFKDHTSNSDDDLVTQTLVARLRYRRIKSVGPSADGPTSDDDSVHLCFVQGLVQNPKAVIGQQEDGWDGAFGDGLLTTYLRRTLADGARLQSRRGLWLDPGSAGLRGGVSALHALLQGRRNDSVSTGRAVFWQSPLPEIGRLDATYDFSDWVVHLDRELCLDVFSGKPGAPTIIEYSDQEVADTPGYDTITVTRHATPYQEQLGEILTTAGLSVADRPASARVAANKILDEINALSGSWALDFLMGSVADVRTSTRLQGNVGAALAYRWLRRIEQPGRSDLVTSNQGDVLPVFISLEELLRATSASGLELSEGLSLSTVGGGRVRKPRRARSGAMTSSSSTSASRRRVSRRGSTAASSR